MSAAERADATGPITVVKIGGSTLGAEDTTLEDVVALQQAGERPIVVHGGGAMISDWLDRLDIESRFVDGLRATNEQALDVVLGVLRGVVNVRLVARIEALGGRAVGLCGVDGAAIRAERYDDRLGFVGRVTEVDAGLLLQLTTGGVIPVLAPIGIESPAQPSARPSAQPSAQPLNINADTVAGEIARSVGAARLIFLTDVDGLLDGEGVLLPSINPAEAARLREEGTLVGGMIPKTEACFRASEAGVTSHISNGRLAGTVRRLAAGEPLGTRIGG